MPIQATLMGLGWTVPTDTCRVYNRSGAAVSKGDVMMFDFAQTATETTDSLLGSDSSSFANTITPGGTQAVQFACYGVCLDDIADNGTGRIAVRGRLRVNTADVGVGVALGITPSSHQLRDPGLAEKVVGISLENNAAAGLTDVLFDGINGFGTVAA